MTTAEIESRIEEFVRTAFTVSPSDPGFGRSADASGVRDHVLRGPERPYPYQAVPFRHTTHRIVDLGSFQASWYSSSGRIVERGLSSMVLPTQEEPTMMVMCPPVSPPAS